MTTLSLTGDTASLFRRFLKLAAWGETFWPLPRYRIISMQPPSVAAKGKSEISRSGSQQTNWMVLSVTLPPRKTCTNIENSQPHLPQPRNGSSFPQTLGDVWQGRLKKKKKKCQFSTIKNTEIAYPTKELQKQEGLKKDEWRKMGQKFCWCFVVFG